MGLQTVTKGQLPLGSDINQLIRLFQSLVDVGAVTLPGQTSAPSTAPMVTLSSGSITGTGYQWGFYWITGTVNDSGTASVTGRTTVSPYSTAQSLTSQQATVSISGITIPTAVIGWGVVRNKSGGSTWYEVPGSEQFGNSDGTNIPVTYVDDTADANLVTAEPSSNTTGTSLTGEFIGTMQVRVLGSGSELDTLDIFDTTASAPTPHKYIRVNSGKLEIVDSGFTTAIFDLDDSGNMTIPGNITSSAGELGSASGTWTPASGSLNVAVGTVINVSAVPAGAKSLVVQSTSGYSPSFTWIGGMNPSGFFGMNLTAAQAYGTTFWANAISGTTIGGDGVSMGAADGSYVTNGYFQIDNGYLQFVTTGTPTANTTSAEVVRWAVN